MRLFQIPTINALALALATVISLKDMSLFIRVIVRM